MAKKKVSASEVTEHPEAEEVVTASELVGKTVPAAETGAEREGQQADLDEAPRRSARERRMEDEAHQAERNLRQKTAVIVGKYINAEKRHNVLGGVIAGTEIRDGHVFWAIYEGPVVVLIPFREALPQQSTDISHSEVRQRQMLAKSIGANVAFSVESMVQDGDNYLVYGSRKNANARIRSRYFGENASNPVNEGDDVQAEFLAVGPHAAWVNIYGVDARIVAAQVSHRYMNDMSEIYKAGDKLKVRIQSIKHKDDEVALTISALPCEVEAARGNLSRVRQGNRYVATISTHRVVNATNRVTRKKEPMYVASMWLEGIEVPAYASTPPKASGTPYSGDRVIVEVDGIAQNGYVRCKIMSYLP